MENCWKCVMSTTIVSSCPPMPVDVISRSKGTCWEKHTIVGVGVSSTARLHFELIVNGAFDDRRDVLGGFGVRDCRGSDSNTKIVRFDMRNLEQWCAFES